MTKDIDLSIIIVTYNSEKTVQVLLDSIKKSKDGFTKEVIVVDNLSSDDSVTVAHSHSLKPKVVKMTVNAGFSKAVNRGISESSGKYVLLLNPDTVVLPGALKKLIDFANNTSPLGAVAPRLLNPSGKPQPSIFKFPTIGNAIRRDFLNCKNCFGKYLPDNHTQKVEVAVMAALLIPRNVLNQIGFLDERFFLYYEDFEFCRRLKKANLPVYYLPAAKIKHIHGASGHFVYHLKSPLLTSARTYYGVFYSEVLNSILWIGHKWQVILRHKRFRD